MPQQEQEAEVVIIGGGIVGCSAAYYLAKRGVQVALIEKGDIAGEQSSRNWGWVHQQVRHPQIIPLAVMSTEIWAGLEQELGADLEWEQGGNFSLGFDDEDMADFESWCQPAHELGLETAMLTRDEVAGLVPAMSGPWVGAIHVPSDGQASPQLATAAFAAAAERHGARIHTRCAVERIELSAGAVAAVVTEQGRIRTGQVVCAAGAWSARVARPLGLKLPQQSVRSTVVRTAPTEPVTTATAWGDQVTFRQDRQGRFVLAGGGGAVYDLNLDMLRNLRQFLPMAWRNRRWLSIRAGGPLLRDLRTLVPGSPSRRHAWAHLRDIDPAPHRQGARRTIERFRELFPSLAQLPVEHVWAGNIDSTPDQAPALGPVDSLPGFMFATGFSGHGFAMGPGAGKVVSELLLDEGPSIDLRRYRFARFAENDLAPMKARRR
ncbi:MAG: FAD-binding oxidoreductase [Dehalococcoidia bacterium]|jgi:glycine/D-amino acid oxidase-like deaminating enzyme|nr:FAD-binding oxidoreductase [Dehalococcoidia bacterium]